MMATVLCQFVCMASLKNVAFDFVLFDKKLSKNNTKRKNCFRGLSREILELQKVCSSPMLININLCSSSKVQFNLQSVNIFFSLFFVHFGKCSALQKNDMIKIFPSSILCSLSFNGKT